MDQKLVDYLASPEFRLFQDEELRRIAMTTVDRIIQQLNDENFPPIKRSQLNSISASIQMQGIRGLVELAKNQKEKNTKKGNKKFWSILHEHLTTPNDPNSLRAIAIRVLTSLQIVNDVKTISEKAEQGRQKTLNRKAVDGFLDAIAATYFEHFVCHFYYCQKRG